MTGKTVVIGIGNALLSDEGLGVRAVDAIKPFYTTDKSIEFIDGGTLSFTLINFFDNSDNLIIIDATNLRADPGTIQIFIADDVTQFLNTYKPNAVHDVNLFDVLTTARLMNRYPKNIALIAVQPKTMSWGTCLTEAVQSALPQVNRHVSDLFDQWDVSHEAVYSY